MFLIKFKHLEKLIKEKKIRKIGDDLHFFVLSSEIPTDMSYPNLDVLDMLLPSEMMIFQYIDGDESISKLNKKYIKNIKENDDLFLGIINILLTISNGKTPIIVTEDEELELGFVEALLDFIKSRYGIKTIKIKSDDYKKVVDYEPEITDEDAFKTDLKKCKHLIESENIIDILEGMDKKDIKKFIMKKFDMDEDEFEDKFGDDYKKKKLIKFLMKN